MFSRCDFPTVLVFSQGHDLDSFPQMDGGFENSDILQ